MSVLAHEIMTPTIKAVPHNWTMDRLARFLTDNEITGSPVTDDNGDTLYIFLGAQGWEALRESLNQRYSLAADS